MEKANKRKASVLYPNNDMIHIFAYFDIIGPYLMPIYYANLSMLENQEQNLHHFLKKKSQPIESWL